MEVPELDREALLALLDRMLRAEAVTDAPPAAERGGWLYGSAGFTEPDEHGWMAPLPSDRNVGAAGLGVLAHGDPVGCAGQRRADARPPPIRWRAGRRSSER